MSGDDKSPEWDPKDDPLDFKFNYRLMQVLPPLPPVAPKPEEDMLMWQQFQRLRFEMRERGLPTDGSYLPPVSKKKAPGRSSLNGSKKKSGGTGLWRSISTPHLDADVAHQHRLSIGGSMGSARRGGFLGKSSSSPRFQRARSESMMQAKVATKSVTALVEKARQQLGNGLFDKAVLAYDEIISEVLAQRAFCLIQMGEYEEGVRNCDMILEFKPEHGKALVRKGKCLVCLDQVEEAKECWIAASDLVKEDDPELWEVGQLTGLLEQDVAAPIGGLAQQKSPKSPKGRPPRPQPKKTLPPLKGKLPPPKVSPRSAKSPPPRKALPKPPPEPKTLPSMPAPRAPGQVSEVINPPAVKKEEPYDMLDLMLDYGSMADDEIPHLPSNPPSVDDDMLRWQQYQRLKFQYLERKLNPKFCEWKPN